MEKKERKREKGLLRLKENKWNEENGKWGLRLLQGTKMKKK